MALPQTNEGFLSPDISVQSDFGLGEQSALLTQEDIKPSQPYKVTTVQETIPGSPAVAVRSGYDPFSGDIESIISPFTDPEAIKERRKKEEAQRKQIKPVGEADPLFETEPQLDIGTAEVPQLRVDTPDPTLQISPKPGQDLVARVGEYFRQPEYEERGVKDPFEVDLDDMYKESIKSPMGVYTTGGETVSLIGSVGGAYDAFRDDLFNRQTYLNALPSDAARQSAAGLMDSVNEPTLLYQGLDKLGLVDTARQIGQDFSFVNKLYDPAANVIREAYSDIATGVKEVSESFQKDLASSVGGKENLGKVVKGAGVALSAYSAYDAFKRGDNVSGAINTFSTVAMLVPTLQPIAIALQAANFVSGLTGFGRGKPKPGMGGSELKYVPETGQLAHSSTWSYNGYNPSQAKQHTDKAVRFVNEYMKEFKVKLNPEKFPKGQSNWQYLSRIDVSPYKNGSQSAGELIERWMSSGAFTGNPTYYDPNLGERINFTSQEQYEQYVSRFADRIFG